MRAVFPYLSLIFACSASVAADPPPKPAPAELPALSSVPTTLERMLKPRRAVGKPGPNPSAAAELDRYLAEGFGELDPAVGEPYVTRTIDGTAAPPPGPNMRRLVRFAHLADFQLLDDEAPTRFSSFDAPGLAGGALRPQDAEICRMVNATVRSVNVLHQKDPFAFVLLGGDNIDNAQENELDWLLSILSGSPNVECDSGADDDVTPGPGNDGKDPFVAEGLRMPFKWVSGNHDALVQGNFAVNEQAKVTSLGSNANEGTRDYTQRGDVRMGEWVTPDPRRVLLGGPELMKKVAAHGDGHGIGTPQIERGRAFHSFDVEGTQLTFLVLDTTAATGGPSGLVRRSDWDAFVKPVLDRTKAEKRWVVLASHHSANAMSEDGGIFGYRPPDVIPPAEFKALLAGYDHILFSMVGHSHTHRVTPMTAPTGHAYWEVMTSAIADYPHQFRAVEIFDADNGWILMRATCIDFAVDGDPVAELGRKKGIVDLTSGWLGGDDSGRSGPAAEDRNVELWIRKP